MSFAAAVDHLHALTQELAPSASAPRRKFDLAHMRTLAHALGDPQTKSPSILIAGTNGKGSTAATLAAILTAAGYRTGLYTSPHLTRVTERIRSSADLSFRSGAEESAFRNLAEIPEPIFARLYFQVDDAARALVTAGELPHHPSFFEVLTALAFLYFAEIKVDIAVLEVGLGGRLDATNIVEPLLSVITDIALDHQDYLGHTLTEIAREKSGILRPNGTLITLPQHPEANQAIGEAAIALNVRAINAADYLPGRSFQHSKDDSSPNAVILSGARSAQSKDPEDSDPATLCSNLSATILAPLAPNHYTLTLDHQPLQVRSPLAGQHQQRNIALAIAAAVELLASPTSPLKLHPEPSHAQSASSTARSASNLEPRTSNLIPAIERGIAHTHWPGRLEFLPPNLLLDVAHNPAGAWTLRAAIATLPEDQPRTLIFSCLRDKDLTEISRILFPLFDSAAPLLSSRGATEGSASPPSPTHHLILTPIQNSRAASLDDLLAAARALDVPAHPANTPAEALALARTLTPANGVIIVTGSIYLIGALREAALTP